jgi:SAM-dependent methyltransferase
LRAVFVRLPPAGRVLDFGCGTGWVISEAQTEGAPRKFGVDISQDALRAGKRADPCINFVRSDALNLPFAGGSFDIVIGHVSLPYMNTRLALREIHRVMAPGGAFFLTFHSFRGLRGRLRNSWRQRRWKDVLFSFYIALNGILNHCGLPQFQARWSRYRFETVNTPSGVCRSARAEGFVLVCAEQGAERIFFAATARKPNGDSAAVLPAPGWSAYCPLAGGQWHTGITEVRQTAPLLSRLGTES